MAKKVTTLYVDDTRLNLLMAEGKKVKKWASLALEPGLVSGGVITDPARLASELKDLLKSQGMKGKKVIAGLSGLHCLYRVMSLPSLPKALMAEAVTREAERLLPVALEELYISWQTIHYYAQEARVFLAACPRSATDSLIETLNQAGIELYLMDVTPLALARVVDKPTAIIVSLRPNEVDIVIMARQVPELIRSLPLAGESLSLPGKLSIVREELEQTIKFYNSNNTDQPLDSDVPVYVCGDLGEEPELDQSSLDKLGHSVSPLPSPLKCPKGLPVAQYMVNIGLALKKLSPHKGANLSLVNLNLIPEAHQHKPPSLAKILITPTIIVAIGLLIPFGMYVRDASSDTALVEAKLDNAKQLVQRKNTIQQSQKKEIAKLKDRVAELEATNNAFTTVLDHLGSKQDMVKAGLEVVTSSLPSNTILSTIDQTSNALTIIGNSPSEKEVLSYARSLDNSGTFTEVFITRIHRIEDGGMGFTLIIGDSEHD